MAGLLAVVQTAGSGRIVRAPIGIIATGGVGINGKFAGGVLSFIACLQVHTSCRRAHPVVFQT